MEETSRLEIPVSAEFRRYIDAVIVRLGYLLPDVTLEILDNSIIAIYGSLRDAPALRKEIAHCLYREKIYQETLPMRRQMVDALTQRS